MAVMHGNPGGTGMFTVRLRFADGYRIPPHTHPTDEHVMVVSGTFRVGMGTTFDAKAMMALSAAGFITAPANGAHYGRRPGSDGGAGPRHGPIRHDRHQPARHTQR
jgi:quercetin dioxygenase-like cupin family protein